METPIGPYVLLAIHDTGCGIDNDTMDHIFEPFYTTKQKEKGTGLGLSTVYGIVKQSGGDILVQSALDQGTTMKVYLPRTMKESQQREVRKRTHSIAGFETILVVEDEEALLKLVSRILRSKGYTVLEASRPESALEICKLNWGRIQLVLTDVILPSMSGRELVDRLKEIEHGIMAIYMSGYTDEIIAPHGVLDEGVEFVKKPFTDKDIINKVREVLDR